MFTKADRKYVEMALHGWTFYRGLSADLRFRSFVGEREQWRECQSQWRSIFLRLKTFSFWHKFPVRPVLQPLLHNNSRVLRLMRHSQFPVLIVALFAGED